MGICIAFTALALFGVCVCEIRYKEIAVRREREGGRERESVGEGERE